jgi:Spy/CpxP family protein refolding chaperone
MTRRVYFYFALTFLLGIIIGGFGVYFFAWYSGHWRRGFDRERMVNHFKTELNLSDAQVQQLRQILEDTGKKFSDLQKQVEPQFRAVREDADNRIRQILTPEQTAKFNDLIRKREQRHRQRSH